MFTFGSNDVFSDLVKDVYGTRSPAREGGHLFSYNHECDEVKQEMWDSLCYKLEENMKHEKIAEEKAVTDFKERIEQAQVWGARDYWDALRWITGCETFYHIQDIEHFVWEQGILFTDFGKQLIKDIEKVTEYKEYA